MPWEFFKGQKFDINRWLGDGVDIDSNGATNVGRDDPGEAGNEWAWPFATNSGLPAPFQMVGPNGVFAQHTNSVPYEYNGYTSSRPITSTPRQLYARHLFCLAMLLLPDTFDPEPQPGSNYDAALLRRLRLASTRS